MYTKEQFWNTD